MKTLNANDFIKILRENGFVFDRQAKGSHEIWYNPTTRNRVVVANHGSKDIPKKTLRKMIGQSGLDVNKFR
ncbi:MAG: type II toxin-antitoxin system HicA family toxin [Candidatus Altiarchaeota archaeon]|nr:type II toxin-antitoxin system HicA family toxin [Candidatus Altiarchaeota archaeon]